MKMGIYLDVILSNRNSRSPLRVTYSVDKGDFAAARHPEAKPKDLDSSALWASEGQTVKLAIRSRTCYISL